MKKKLIAAVLMLAVMAVLIQPLPTISQTEEQGADFRSGIIKYILEDPLLEVPNTFESWIFVEEDAEGTIGCIFGNNSTQIPPPLRIRSTPKGKSQ